jgi:hypothetical protein
MENALRLRMGLGVCKLLLVFVSTLFVSTAVCGFGFHRTYDKDYLSVLGVSVERNGAADVSVLALRLLNRRNGFLSKFLVGLVSMIILVPSLSWLMAIFHCFRFQTCPVLVGTGHCTYIPPPTSMTGWPSCAPRHWVPFSSPLTTRRAEHPLCHLFPHVLLNKLKLSSDLFLLPYS